jgi:MFS family permease
MFVSLIGTWIQTVTLSWLVFQLTKSAYLLGVVGFLGTFPIFLFCLFGGVLADRMNKRNILLCTQTLFMCLAFILAALTQMKFITPVQIMVIAVLNGIVMAFDAPSRQAMVVDLVGKQHLLNAIALNSVAFNSSRIIGPVLAGIFVASIGMSGCFYINGISFLAAIFALIFIRLNHQNKNHNNKSALGDAKAGLALIKRKPLILALLLMVSVTSLFGISYMILMPVFAQQVLGVGIKELGYLMSSAGIGALCAGLTLARLGDFKFKGRLLVFSSLSFSVALILFSQSKQYAVSLVILLAMGGFGVMATAIINTLLQSMVEDEFRGRIMSVFMITFVGIMPFGNLVAGIIAQIWGVSLAVFLSGITCFSAFVIINLLVPDLRRL